MDHDDISGVSDGGLSIIHERADTTLDKFILVRRDEIEPNPYQYREDWGDLPGLAKSIEKNGIITALIGRPNPGTRGKPYQLAAGERRLRASGIAGLTHVPMIVRSMGDDEMIEVLFQENLNRKDTTPLEEARGFNAALDRAYTVEQLMTKTGRSRGFIYGRVKLLELAPGALKALQSGELPAAHAELIARIADRDAQERCTREVLGKIDNELRDDLARLGIEHESLAKPDATSEDLSGFPPRAPQLLSFRATKDLIRRRYMTKLATATFDPNDASLLPSTGACTPCAHRAGNQPALPGLVEAGKGDDYCTKPSCFESKTNAAFKREAARAVERGVKVLASANDTRLVFGYNATDVAGGSPYVDPSDKMPADIARAGASQSWAKALGRKLAEVPRVLVQDGTGAPRELLDREAAVERLRELGKIDKPLKPEKSKPDRKRLPKEGKVGDTHEQLEQERESHRQWLKRLEHDVIVEVSKGIPERKEMAWWRWAIRILCAQYLNKDCPLITGIDQRKPWDEQIVAKASNATKARAIMTGLLVSELVSSSWNGNETEADGEALLEIVGMLGIDHEEIAEELAPKRKCEAVSIQDPDYVCVKEKGHKGPHESERRPGGTTASWSIAGGRETGKRYPINLAGKNLAQTGGWSCFVDDGDAERKLDKGLAAIASKEKKPKPKSKSKSTKVVPGRCSAMHDPYGQCELAPGHTGDHRAHTEQKSEIFWSGRRAMDGKDCGAMPAKKGDPCILDVGHEGVHSNGRITWSDRKPKKKGGGK